MRKRLGWIRTALVVGTLAIAAVTGAQLIPLGDEFQVNTYETSTQSLARVTAIDGGFVVVWQSNGSPGTDTDGRSIQARRFDTYGQPVGTQFQINQLTAEEQTRPSLHSLDEGGFVTQWSSVNPDGVPFSIYYARPFDSQGVPMTDDFAIATGSETTTLWGHSISQTVNGDLISAYGVQTSNSYAHMEVGLFDLTGNPITSHVVFEQNFTVPAFPTLDRSPNGSFVVAWVSQSQYEDVVGRRLSLAGTPTGSPFYPTAGPVYTFVNWPIDVDFRDDGKFVVAWADTTFDLYYFFEEKVIALPFESDGTISGVGADIASPESPSGSEPVVDPMTDGNFLVVWADDQDSGDDDVLARVIDDRGQLLSEPQRLNSVTAGNRFDPDLAASPDGQHFLVVWTDQPTGSSVSADIRGRFFRSGTIFGDGFESGDVSRWSLTSPPSPSAGGSGGG